MNGQLQSGFHLVRFNWPPFPITHLVQGYDLGESFKCSEVAPQPMLFVIRRTLMAGSAPTYSNNATTLKIHSSHIRSRSNVVDTGPVYDELSERYEAKQGIRTRDLGDPNNRFSPPIRSRTHPIHHLLHSVLQSSLPSSNYICRCC